VLEGRRGVKNGKIVSVRMTASRRKELEALAFVDGTTLGEQVRRAIRKYVASRIRRKTFETERQAARERLNRLFDGLVALAKASGD
jgi:hypothetical protein